MKKIVGILAAAAVLATSVFAADVSAATKIKGPLFNYDGAKETMSLFSEVNDSHDYANPNFTFSISDDKAGATLKITTDGTNLNAAQTTQTIWFKPIDALKFTIGNYDIALNKEQIDWTESITGLGGNGYLVSVNVSGFGLDLGFENNNSFWMTKGKEGDPALKQFFVKAGYGADFGNIGAFVEMNRIAKKWTYHDAFVTDGTTAFDQKDGSIKNMMFGAGYSNNFNGINMFVNVVGYMGKSFDWVRPEVYVAGKVNAFGFALFAAPIIFTNADLKKDAECEVVAKLTYALDGVTPYLYFKDNNLMAKTFTSTIKLGATGSCGLMGWNIWAQIDTAEKVNFSVPFELTVSF